MIERGSWRKARVIRRDTGTENIATTFHTNLEQAKPYLFALAENVVQAYPDRQWDTIIGDDTSGRLPTRFIRKVLEGRGITMPTRYVCASGTARSVVPQEDFVTYFDTIADPLPADPRALVVTETIRFGETANFIDTQMHRRFTIVDFAAAAVRYPHMVDLTDNLYAGSEGPEAGEVIFRTFEKPYPDTGKDKLRAFVKLHIPVSLRRKISGQVHLGSFSSHPITYLNPPDDDHPYPFAQTTTDSRHRALAFSAYFKMDALAKEFNVKS